MMYPTKEYLEMMDRQNEDCLRNRMHRDKSNEALIKIVRGAIADEKGRKAANSETAFIHWEEFLETRIAKKLP